jgi:hypothetical protein
VIHVALSKVGVTPESVSGWLGAPCGCERRRERLNALSAWASRIVSGKVDRALTFLKAIMGVKE